MQLLLPLLDVHSAYYLFIKEDTRSERTREKYAHETCAPVAAARLFAQCYIKTAGPSPVRLLESREREMSERITRFAHAILWLHRVCSLVE